MTRAEFIEALKIQTSDAALDGIRRNLERAPGKKPRNSDIELSDWYRSLTKHDQTHVKKAMQEASELAVFSFLCVLDGVSAIEDGANKGSLQLIYKKNGREAWLNDEASAHLHDIYNALCQEKEPAFPVASNNRAYAVAPKAQLRERQRVGDAMDLHVISPAESKNTDLGAPAIALPKNEHRKLNH